MGNACVYCGRPTVETDRDKITPCCHACRKAVYGHPGTSDTLGRKVLHIPTNYAAEGMEGDDDES